MKRYAIFFAATGPLAGRNYMPDTNVLLNSIQDRRLHESCDGTLDVYLFHFGFDPAWDYIQAALDTFDFKFIPIELRMDDPEIPHPDTTNNIEFTKRARYFQILKYGRQYDAICLMDADMYFVAREFAGFFDLVAGTNKLIGANEKFKWDVGPQSYFLDEKPIFESTSRMHTMICNVPSVFDMNHWREVFEFYTKICFEGYQYKGENKVGIGDLFAHNIAIHHAGRDSDVHALPMETVAQVHHVWRRPWTYLINDNGYWRSQAGDRVYVIHDTKKMSRPEFLPGNMAKYREELSGWNGLEKVAPKIVASLRAVQKEWYRLQFECALPLDRFIEKTPEWEALK